MIDFSFFFDTQEIRGYLFHMQTSYASSQFTALWLSSFSSSEGST